MPMHEHRGMAGQCPCQRRALFRLHDQEIRCAEFVVLVPERHVLADGRAQMKHGHERNAGDAERHDRRRVMMADRHDVGTRLKDAAVDDALGIKVRRRLLYRL
jgi:hypothetical protein